MEQTMNFRGIIEDMIRKLREATEPGQTLGTSRADVRLIGQQYQEAAQAMVKGFELDSTFQYQGSF